MKSIRIAAFTLALTTVASADWANLITNGSFENGTDPGGFRTVGAGGTDITAWQVLQGNVDYIGSHWQAADGVRSIDLNGNQQGQIGQTFATVIGQVYNVRFAMAGNPDSGPAVKALVAAAGAVSPLFQFDITGHSRTNMGWEYFTFQFTANSLNTQLSFLSQTGSGGGCGACFGPALDDVSVTVPEPVTLLLFGSGIVAMFARRRQ